jgi:hypothetical protein
VRWPFRAVNPPIQVIVSRNLLSEGALRATYDRSVWMNKSECRCWSGVGVGSCGGSSLDWLSKFRRRQHLVAYLSRHTTIRPTRTRGHKPLSNTTYWSYIVRQALRSSSVAVRVLPFLLDHNGMQGLKGKQSQVPTRSLIPFRIDLNTYRAETSERPCHLIVPYQYGLNYLG